jgi:hypothetical protein
MANKRKDKTKEGPFLMRKVSLENLMNASIVPEKNILYNNYAAI